MLVDVVLCYFLSSLFQLVLCIAFSLACFSFLSSLFQLVFCYYFLSSLIGREEIQLNDYADVQYPTTSANKSQSSLPTVHKPTETPSLRDNFLVNYDAKEVDDCELLAI